MKAQSVSPATLAALTTTTTTTPTSATTSSAKLNTTKTKFLAPVQQPQQQQKQLYATGPTRTAASGAGAAANQQPSSVIISSSRQLKSALNSATNSLAHTAATSSAAGVNYSIAAAVAKRPQLTIVAKRPPATTSAPAANSTTIATVDAAATESNKMEHSYTRDSLRPALDMSSGLAPARTILVRRPPQCPSCHTHPLEEHDLSDGHQAAVPTYNEIAAKEAMNECARIAKYVKNANADDEDWEAHVNQLGWSNMQKTLFAKVVSILDSDQLGRLSHAGRQNEAMQRRVIVDKSAARMRKALASVAWDARLTQWLHCLLMDCLPSTYMASYLDILQTLKSKLPSLIDKMLFGRPLNVSQELLAPVMKKQWEPVVNSKTRKLSQDAVIVALPSMPASGPVPKRLQKWYQHLATITQIVQITLPTSSAHIHRQPLEQVAEQIVSLTRVKIQDLRNENPARSIILIGFNAGAALALQVAMSENVACVVCMGFAYNTFNGVRGAPDDRILDIKVPILFVIGQNSARSSPEEIESLRERMQSESSLVVVGSADDVLRVPKSRRKIENVTQSMVDTMVVDEVYDFITKILTNPPGPRIPTSITSAIYAKHNKSALGGEKAPVQQRKRKQDADHDLTPAKSKYMGNIGRPRTRPLNTATTPTAAGKMPQMRSSTPLGAAKVQQKAQLSQNTLTNDDLNMAIQSIITDSSEADSNTTLNPGSSSAAEQNTQKMVTNFELVAQSKTTPMKTALLSTQQKQLVLSSSANLGGSGSPPVGTKIKMIPSNQFVQLKPPLQSQSKIYTIKPATMLGQGQSSSTVGSSGANIGSIVTTAPNAATSGGQQHIFTLKTPTGQTTQFATAVGGQPKYTLLKNASAGGTTLQLSTAKPVVGGGIAGGSSSSSGGNLDISNIIDMPIIFADNEGNLSDAVGSGGGGGGGVGVGGAASNEPSKVIPTTTSMKPSTSSGVGQLIISQKIIKEASSPSSGAASTTSGTYVISKPGTIIQSQQLANKPNKVVFINRNTMKPCPNIISRSSLTQQQLPKYTKVVVTNPKTAATTLVPRPGTQITSTTGTSGTSGTSPITSSVKQINLQALNTSSAASSPVAAATRPSGILNVQTKALPQFQIINKPGASVVSADKPQIRNIVVKPGGLKQLPPHLTTQLLNRNLTVRKLVNIVPVSKSTSVPATTAVAGVTITTSPVASSGAAVVAQESSAETSGSSTASPVASTSAIQSSPKIITLNPVNPSSGTSSKSD